MLNFRNVTRETAKAWELTEDESKRVGKDI